MVLLNTKPVLIHYLYIVFQMVSSVILVIYNRWFQLYLNIHISILILNIGCLSVRQLYISTVFMTVGIFSCIRYRVFE